MTTIASLLLLLLLLLPAFLSGPARYVAGPDSLHPRLIFPDSLVTLNDRCAVRQNKLNSRMRPVYVNGIPIGFC